MKLGSDRAGQSCNDTRWADPTGPDVRRWCKLSARTGSRRSLHKLLGANARAIAERAHLRAIPRRPRKRDRVADIGEARDVGERAREAQAEARVRHRP